ncbi:MAG: cytidylate kinase-like family protein [Magnetococcales bacterium]|nr:cytidylate kinase-like family protein [Magnetococcales bacterium]
MSRSSLETIQAIIQASHYVDHPDRSLSAGPRPLITVSRSCGSDGTEVARRVAAALGVACYDRELLQKIVKELKANRHLMEQIDEKVTGVMDDVLQSLFSKKSVPKDLFFRYMTKVILSICKTGGVIVGRGAHLLIPEQQPVLRVRIEGSLDVCSKRLAARMAIKPAKARQLIEKTNAERDAFVAQLYRKFPTQRTHYDLLINSDLFTLEQAVRIILAAAHTLGLSSVPVVE